MTAENQRKSGIIRLVLRLFMALTGGFLALALVGALLITNGVTAPEWLRASLEARLNASIPMARVHIAQIRLAPFGPGLNPRIRISGIELRDQNGQVRASLPEITGAFDGRALLEGKLRPVSITITDAHMRLARDRSGTFDLSVGGSEGKSASVLGERVNFGKLLGDFEKLFDIPLLSELSHIKSTGTRVVLNDQLSGRIWVLRDGNLDFRNTSTSLEGSMTFKLENEAGRPASATFGWSKQKGESISKFSTRFSGLQTGDVANQVALFDWLKVLDAPISGSVTLDVLADGSFGNMNGVLELGPGRIRQSPKMSPVRFGGAKAYLSYDRKQEKFTFDEITLETGAGSIKVEGQAYLGDRIDRTVGSLIGQFKFTNMRLDPAGVFQNPVTFDQAVLDVRIRTAPLVVDIGQLVLSDGSARYVIRGQIKAKDDGWSTALDMSVKSLSRSRIMALWPLAYKPKTRDWISKNVLDGRLENIHAALRGKPGQRPEIGLGFDLKNLSVRFMKALPVIENGAGYGVMNNNKLHLTLEKGDLRAPEGGTINLAGTSFNILDTRVKNAPARVVLATQSGLQAMLSVLDLKPFNFLSKAGLGTDIATGSVATRGTIRFPLSGKVMFDQVSLKLNGTISRARSDKLFRGKVVSAKRLNAYVDDTGLTISGSAKLGKLPVSGLWRQNFGPKNKGRSKIEGQIELSQAFLKEFRIDLPKGAVKGRGTGHFVVDLRRGKAPRFRLISDLNRIGLSLAALGWSKPKNGKGQLDIRGSFGRPPKIDRLSIKARGLTAVGSVTLKPDGSLDVARFETVDIGGWMRTPIEIRIGSNGNAAFTITGGVLDFRKSRFAETRGVGKGTQIKVKLDRLILSSGIALTNVEGNLNTAGGVTGSFSGRVNGGARIVGTLAPYNGGTAVRFVSKDAGAVMRSAGIFDSAIGGRLDMILTPSGKPGHYNGTLEAKKTRVKNATALASILSAISVVGLLEQLGGEGIAFNTVSAKFQLTPTSVTLQESSAVGASLGLTMEGVYDIKNHKMDMQGVVTPIYMLNGILAQSKLFGGLFGKKKGEGLFGFNYTLKGDTDAPKVGVNPLSILTPGLFREIFHKPMPKAAE